MFRRRKIHIIWKHHFSFIPFLWKNTPLDSKLRPTLSSRTLKCLSTMCEYSAKGPDCEKAITVQWMWSLYKRAADSIGSAEIDSPSKVTRQTKRTICWAKCNSSDSYLLSTALHQSLEENMPKYDTFLFLITQKCLMTSFSQNMTDEIGVKL